MVVLRDRYQIIRQIGQGGFGKTYLAEDLDRLNEPCVVKQLSPQVGSTDSLQKAAELFEGEAKCLRDLGEHPQIPMLYAYFEEDRNFYLVQQFIKGKNLAEDLQEEGMYGEREIIDLLSKLLPVLKFVHQHQVIHRDIKPENIIRCNDDRLVLVDFGASKYLTSPILKTGTVIGTAGYVSPEQAVGKPVFSSDLYSLGVTCIHLLTGIEPFQLYGASEGHWVWRDYLTQPINSSLGQILDKMLEPAKRRFQSADEVLQVLSSGINIVESHQIQHSGTLVIYRKSKATGSIYKVRVEVDGKKVAEIKGDETITLSIPAGEHTLRVAGGGLSRVVGISIAAGQHLRFQTEFSDWGILGGGLKLDKV